MSKVILGFVLLVLIVMGILLFLIIIFSGAVLVFSGKEKKVKEVPEVLTQPQGVTPQGVAPQGVTGDKRI